MAKYDDENNTRYLIVETAKKLFYERGFEAVSVNDVAQASHVVRNSVRYYFKTKRDLQRAASDDLGNRLMEITVHKLKLDKLNWSIISILFWYRFYKDEKYREFTLQCFSWTESDEQNYHYVYEYMYKSYTDGALCFDEFVAQYQLTMDISLCVQGRLVDYYAARLEQTDYIEAAKSELLLTLRLYGIPDELINSRIDDAIEILPSLDLEKMSEYLF